MSVANVRPQTFTDQNKARNNLGPKTSKLPDRTNIATGTRSYAPSGSRGAVVRGCGHVGLLFPRVLDCSSSIRARDRANSWGISGDYYSTVRISDAQPRGRAVTRSTSGLGSALDIVRGAGSAVTWGQTPDAFEKNRNFNGSSLNDAFVSPKVTKPFKSH